MNFLICAVLVSFILSLIPWGKYVLYPFKLFTTWAHECCHAVMALLMGGQVLKITLASDTSGLCVYKIPTGRLRTSFVASAGYLGACALGCLIYFASVATSANTALMVSTLGVLMLLSLLFWVRGTFGMITVFILGLALFAVGRNLPFAQVNPQLLKIVFSFLGIQTALNALLDLRVLFSVKSKSDAHTMQSLFWLPAGFWTLLWVATSVAMLGFTVEKTVLPHLTAKDRQLIAVLKDPKLLRRPANTNR